MVLQFDVKNQTIKRIDKNRVVAKSKKFLKAQFVFNESWDKINLKTAIFKSDFDEEPYSQILDDEGFCEVPWETIGLESELTVSVFGVGYDGTELITVNKAYVNIEESGYEDGRTPEEPTPSVYQQILAMIDEIKQKAGFQTIVVNKLPSVGEKNTIYLVPQSKKSQSNYYNEYIYVNGSFEQIGTTQVDLTEYTKKTYVDGELAKKQNNLTSRQLNNINDVENKADKSEIPTVPSNVSAFRNDSGYLTRHQELKTINGQSIVGNGNIEIKGGSGGTFNPIELTANCDVTDLESGKWYIAKADIELSAEEQEDTLPISTNNLVISYNVEEDKSLFVVGESGTWCTDWSNSDRDWNECYALNKYDVIKLFGITSLIDLNDAFALGKRVKIETLEDGIHWCYTHNKQGYIGCDENSGSYRIGRYSNAIIFVNDDTVQVIAPDGTYLINKANPTERAWNECVTTTKADVQSMIDTAIGGLDELINGGVAE